MKPRDIISAHILAYAGSLFMQTDSWNQSEKLGISSFGPTPQTGTNNTTPAMYQSSES